MDSKAIELLLRKYAEALSTVGLAPNERVAAMLKNLALSRRRTAITSHNRLDFPEVCLLWGWLRPPSF